MKQAKNLNASRPDHWLDTYWSPFIVLPIWGILFFVLPGALFHFYVHLGGLEMLKLEIALAIFSYFSISLVYARHARMLGFLFAAHAALLLFNWRTEIDGNPYGSWSQTVAVYTALLYMVTGGALFLVRLRTRRPLKL